MVVLQEDGTIVYENETLGILEGFTFKPFATTETLQRAGVPDFLLVEFEKRTDALLNLGDTALRFGKDLSIQAEGHTVARLKKGDHILTPTIELAIDESIQGLLLARLALHIESWIKRHINIPLEALFTLKDATDLGESATAVKNILTDHLGCRERRKIEDAIKNLKPEDRTALRKYGVRFAQYVVFVRDILKPAAINIKLVLDGIFRETSCLPPYPTAGMVTLDYNPELDKSYYALCGFRICDKIAVRVDMIEKLVDTLRPLIEKTESNPNGEFVVDAQMMSLIGRSGEEFETVLKSLGYRFRTEQRPKPAAISPVISENPDKTNTQTATDNTETLSVTEATNEPAPEDNEYVEVKVWFKAPPATFVKKDMTASSVKTREVRDSSARTNNSLRHKKQSEKTDNTKRVEHKSKERTETVKKPKPFVKRQDESHTDKKRKLAKVTFKGDPDSPFAALSHIKNKIV